MLKLQPNQTVLLSALLLAIIAWPGSAKQASSDDNVAVIVGEAGEQYPIYGSGGIRVSGGHHGIFMSNMKRSAIEIDGSGLASGKMAPRFETVDFEGQPGIAHFVSRTAVCTLPAAASSPGQEILVCNDNDTVSITYHTTGDDKLVGPTVNSAFGKVDRLISDGRAWIKE